MVKCLAQRGLLLASWPTTSPVPGSNRAMAGHPTEVPWSPVVDACQVLSQLNGRLPPMVTGGRDGDVPDEILQRLSAALADRYHLKRELGRGGMAVVYLAHDPRHGRDVALKVLRPELAASLGADRFLREIQIAAKLNHPNIVALFDSGEADGLLYYVMPYLEGESLRERLNRERQLPVDEALRIAQQVAEGLGYADELGVIHRDIKPENVLLSRGHALIADFGIARAVSAAAGATLTHPGVTVGTPHYMSPEQAAGDPHVDHRSDLYSLGCVLYEMLAGEPPFTAPTLQGVMAKHAAEPRPGIRTMRDTVPEGVETAIKQAMARVPADRPRKAATLVGALSAGVSTPGPVGHAGVGAAPWRAERRSTGWWNWRAVLAIAALLAIGVVAVRVLGPEAGDAMQGNRTTDAVVPLRAVLYDNPSLAILPLRNLGSEEDRAFVEGLHDDILSALQQIGGLTVISSTSVQRYRGRGMLLPEIARELHVDAVGEGTVSRGGDRIRVNIQLIDGASDAHLWSAQYERELTASNVFALRAEIARAVARAMRATLTSDEEARLDAPPTTSLTAYDWRQIALSRCDGCEERAEAYRNAITADSTYAPAWAGLADNYAVRVLAFGAPTVLAESALAFADRALALDPALATAYAAKGTASYAGWGYSARALEYVRRAAQLEPGSGSKWANVGVFSAMRGQWVEALDAYRRSLRVRPTSVTVRGNMAELYAALGLPQHAEQLLAEAAEIRPTDETVLHYSSYAQALGGDLERARELADRTVQLHPLARNHQWSALLAGRLGDFEAVRSHAESARALAPEGLSLESNVHSVPVTLGFALLHAGDPEGAERLFTAAVDQVRLRLERGADDGYSRVEMAAVAAARGRAGEATRWLESAFERGYRYYREIEIDPMFDGVRAAPGFERVMARIRADVDGMRRRVLEQEVELERARASRSPPR